MQKVLELLQVVKILTQKEAGQQHPVSGRTPKEQTLRLQTKTHMLRDAIQQLLASVPTLRATCQKQGTRTRTLRGTAHTRMASLPTRREIRQKPLALTPMQREMSPLPLALTPTLREKEAEATAPSHSLGMRTQLPIQLQHHMDLPQMT